MSTIFFKFNQITANIYVLFNTLTSIFNLIFKKRFKNRNQFVYSLVDNWIKMQSIFWFNHLIFNYTYLNTIRIRIWNCNPTVPMKNWTHKTCGPTSFLTHLLKVGIHLLSTPLSFMISKSFETVVVPSSLKLVRVVPLFKYWAQDKCGNYHPISLLSSKAFERDMYNRLHSYLETMKIISTIQFGLLKMHFTNYAIVSAIEHVKSILDHVKLCLWPLPRFSKSTCHRKHSTWKNDQLW